MKKKEFKIGEEFQLGLKRLRVEESCECEDCYFNRCCGYANPDFVNDTVGCCEPHAREDKTGVIFKEIKEE